jgi:hypothetical protein|tara:strand:+ start:2705 stop:3385 length:681 start_codon:yes stop_codon:yes gene_type:complete
MTLDDIYNQLGHGELRELFVGGKSIDEPSWGITSENYPILFPSVQLGLTELHKRFLLRAEEVIVPLVTNQTSYVITVPSLFKIERVYGTYREKEYEIPMNEPTTLEAIRNTSYNSLLVPTNETEAPWLKETTSLRVVYRGDHPVIDTAVAAVTPANVDIELPLVYMEPLLLYIASRIHNPIGLTNEFHNGNNYAAKFEASIAQLKSQNYEIDSSDMGDLLYDRGFV